MGINFDNTGAGSVTLKCNTSGLLVLDSVEVVTLSASQTLTSKSLTSPTLTGTVTGPSGSWTSTGINIDSGDAYSINGTSVLNATTLGSGVTASSLTSLGTIASLTATVTNTPTIRPTSTTITLENSAGTETLATFVADGAASLYFNNSVKFATTNAGATLTGTLTASDATINGTVTAEYLNINAFSISRTVTDSLLNVAGGTNGANGASITLHGNTHATKPSWMNLNTAKVTIQNEAQNETMALFTADGAVELYFNNSKKFETTTTGGTITGTLNATTDLTVGGTSVVLTSRTISAGGALTGGGDLSANRTVTLDVSGLTADGTPDGSADYVLSYDASAGSHKKVLMNNIPSSGAGVGSANTFTAINTFTIDDANNSSVIRPVIFRHTTSGAPAAGMGTGIQFNVETATAENIEIVGYLDFVSTDVATGTEDFDFSLKLMAAGAAAAEVMKVTSTGNLSATGTATAQNFLTTNGATSQRYIDLINTGQSGAFFGVESSAGGGFFTGSSAYATVVYNTTSRPIEFIIAGTKYGEITTTGFQGAVGATTASTGSFTSLNATGGGALTGTWTNLGSVTTIDINGGTIDGTTVGATTPASGAFTTLTTTGNVTTGSGVASVTNTVNGLNSGSGGGGYFLVQNASSTVIGIGNYSALVGGAYNATPTIYGASDIAISRAGSTVATFTTTGINNTAIGATTASTGSFTTLNANGGGALTGTWTNLGSVTTIDINGGTIDGTTIGASSRSTGAFTTITTLGNTAPGIQVETGDSSPGGTIRFIQTATATRRNWQIGVQQVNDDTFEIIPSTANGGTTFTSPALTIASAGATFTFPSATTLNINGASPTIASSSTGTLTHFNTNITTVNEYGAATTYTLGNTATAAQTVTMFGSSTGASTYNLGTGATAAATTKTLNLGTGGAASSTTNINIGSSVAGTTTMNSPTVVGASATQALFNTTATTMNAFGAATTMTLGATTGTANIRNATITAANCTTFNMNGASPSIVTSSTGTASVFNTNAATGNLFGAGTTITIGAATGTTSIRNATITLTNATALNINGANPTIASTSTGTLTNFNTNITTVNEYGAVTTYTTGNTTTSAQTVTMFGSSTGASTYNFATGATANATTKTLNIGTAGVSGSITNINIGSAVAGSTGTTTINGSTFATTTAVILKYNGSTKLETVTGGATTTGTHTATDFNATSSIRFKENVKELDINVNQFMNLNPVTFKWKDGFAGGKGDSVGFIAEEVDLIYPLIVNKDEKGQATGIDYGKFAPYHIKVTQEHNKKISKLQKEIRELKALVEKLINNKDKE